MPNKRISIVIPACDEAASVEELIDRIAQAFKGIQYLLHEIIFIDDGSKDGTWTELSRVAVKRNDLPIRGYRLRRNFGKSNALDLGFQKATGGIVITVDADLQDDPSEIGRMLGKLEEGYDMVSGWKRDRKDPVEKTLPSRLFNYITAIASGLRLHDFNCGFKAYRIEVVKSIRLYGEMHRYIPVLAHHQGFSVAEIPVKHHPRQNGVSKYGLERLPRGCLDLFTVVLTTRFFSRPAHLFGGAGLLLVVAGLGILSYLTGIWLFSNNPIGTRPLLSLGSLCVLTGVQLISFGLLAELVIRRVTPSLPASQIRESIGPHGAEDHLGCPQSGEGKSPVAYDQPC